MEELVQFGITKHVGIWLASFLSDRKQFVQIPGGISTYGPVSSGVPQGTVLGPVFFLILIADITKNVKLSNISSFADDTRLYLPIESPTNIDNLQFDLRTVYDWAETNNMKFNSSKFNYVCYHTKNSPNNENIYISPTHDIIKSVTTVRDLGVTMSNSCDFNAHIDKTVKTCSRLVGWILRTFTTCDSTTMLTLFKSIVLPILEYACQLWNPKSLQLVKKLEKVQRSFTKHITGMFDLSYEARLRQLNLYSLQRRRDRYQIIYIWKIIESKVAN